MPGPYFSAFSSLSFEASRDALVTHVCYTLVDYTMRMSIEEISVSGVPTCGSKIGVYEVRLLEGGKIRIVVTKDACSARADDISREYEPVR